MLGGDFNFPDVEWAGGQPVTLNTAKAYKMFLHFVSSFDLHQHVSFPTRLGTTGVANLDLLFSNREGLISTVSSLPGITDHEVVVGRITNIFEIKRPNLPRKVFFTNAATMKVFQITYGTIFVLFRELSHQFDVETIWNLFRKKGISLVNAFIPSRLLGSR